MAWIYNITYSKKIVCCDITECFRCYPAFETFEKKTIFSEQYFTPDNWFLENFDDIRGCEIFFSIPIVWSNDIFIEITQKN